MKKQKRKVRKAKAKARTMKPTAADIRLGLTESEVRDKLWVAFVEWMRGQTCALDSTNTARYYRHDVERACLGLAGVRVDD